MSGRPRLGTGERVDRFEIVRLLGAGGMGAVYEARDPRLARSVALKLIHEPDGHRSVRLLREAQALAQLQHPNVVGVHEVGTWGEQVFIAMELVDGASLDRLAPPPTDWREVVRLYVQAGAGLAEAHAIGLVHRDVKPSNLLVDRGGRVRVADFGLARRVAGSRGAGAVAGAPATPGAAVAETVEDTTAPSDAPDGALGAVDGLLGAPLTRTGSFLGTPRYMAPEQQAGAAATERSDQFSFCVAMWETLFGDQPVLGADGGAPRRPPAGKAPRWLVRLLERGLAADPAARHPSMAALVALLARRSSRGHRVVVALGGVVVGGAISVVVAMVALPSDRAAATPPCISGAAAMAAVWSPARRDALAAAFPDGPAADTAVRVSAALEQRGLAWVTAHREICEATHVHRTQSAPLLDQRMACLDERRAELAAITGALVGADPPRLDRIRSALAEQPAVAACATAGGPAGDALPDAPADRERHAALTAQLAQARVNVTLGGFREARTEAARIATEAERRGWRHLLAEARFCEAKAIAFDGDYTASHLAYETAARAAADAGDDQLAGMAWTRLIGNLAEVGKTTEARALVIAADAAVRRAGDPPRMRHDLLQAEGWLSAMEGDLEGARATLARGLAHGERTLPDDLRLQVQALGNLAQVETVLGRHDEAVAHRRAELALCAREYGRQHPTYADCVGELGQAINNARPGEGRALLGEAVQLLEASRAPASGHLAALLQNLGNADALAGDHAAAEAHLTRAIAIFETTGAPRHVARAYAAVAQNRLAAGDRAGARSAAGTSVAMFESAVGVDHPDHAIAVSTLASIATCAEARPDLARAVDVLARSYGAEHPVTLDAIEQRDRCAGRRR